MLIAFRAVHAVWREAATPHPGMAETCGCLLEILPKINTHMHKKPTQLKLYSTTLPTLNDLCSRRLINKKKN